METIIELARTSAKAIVAAVVPIIVAFIVDASGELTILAVGGITAAAGAITVWLVPNKITPGQVDTSVAAAVMASSQTTGQRKAAATKSTATKSTARKSPARKTAK